MGRSKVVEYDEEEDETTKLLRTIPPGISSRTHSISGTQSIIVEPEDIKKSRWRSIRIMYLTMFLSSVSFSICMSSLYPYLKILDPSAGTNFLGWVVAAYSVGQLIASPVFGAWSNWKTSYRNPIMVSITINVLANILFMYLESIKSAGKVWLLLARGLIGFGAGNVAVVRAYLSSATTLDERTSTMANLSAFQAVGFIIGPLIQAALVPIGYPGLVHSNGLHLDMYTATGLLGALLGILNVVLLVCVFKEHTVKDDQFDPVHIQSGGSSLSNEDQDEDSEFKPKYTAVITSISLFFSVLFVFAVFETIATPLSMNMFGWTKSKATTLIGVMLGVAGVISILVFVVIKILSQRINERFILFGGFVFCLAGFVVYLPFGNQYPVVQIAELSNSVNVSRQDNIAAMWHGNVTDLDTGWTRYLLSNSSVNHNKTVESVGCPYEYKWCLDTPAVRLWQLLLGTLFVAIGYPTCNVMSYSIYSKLLGPKPQGIWMGWLTAAGSLARVLGPIFVSQIYDAYGPRITFIAMIILILLTIFGLTLTFKMLVPYNINKEVGVSENHSNHGSRGSADSNS